jgi:hypothetical protein
LPHSRRRHSHHQADGGSAVADILIFLLCAASVVSIIIAVGLAIARLTDARHSLRLDRLSKPEG